MEKTLIPNENLNPNLNLNKNKAVAFLGSNLRSLGSSKALKVLGAAALLGLVYWANRKRHSSEPSNGGMKVGQDSRKIDMTPKYGDGSRDVVEQASWESFPASDPPAY